MNNLFPAMPDVSEIEAVQAQADDTGYKRGLAWDFEAMDFILDAKRGIALCAEYEAWIQWVTKAIATERFNMLYYSTDYGTELEATTQTTDRQAAQMMIERTITEALLADTLERTSYLGPFSFDWEADSVRVRFEIFGQADAMRAVIEMTI